ncbi:hypothetical protein Q1695_011458 [Nippostrongylus brasiliensis]|nr:hypothetical protein Q1695_011458 [Nippostrongylus brasiliensis]
MSARPSPSDRPPGKWRNPAAAAARGNRLSTVSGPKRTGSMLLVCGDEGGFVGDDVTGAATGEKEPKWDDDSVVDLLNQPTKQHDR